MSKKDDLVFEADMELLRRSLELNMELRECVTKLHVALRSTTIMAQQRSSLNHDEYLFWDDRIQKNTDILNGIEDTQCQQ